MSRKQRIHYPGAFYHVMVRGNNGEKVFIDREYKTHYLSIVSHYKTKMDFKFYAYCIMDNHAHILKDKYLLQLIKYIHKNPVRAGLDSG